MGAGGGCGSRQPAPGHKPCLDRLVRILVTGFEPFGGDAENASAVAVEGLRRRWAAGDGGEGSAELVTAVLPVSFARAPRVLRALVRQHEPEAVIAVGEAGNREVVTPERWGRNRVDARIPDNDGDQPRDRRIDDGPELRPAGLDVEDMVARIRAGPVAASLSDSAGEFVCNRVAVAVTTLGVPGAFVHVPAVRSAGTASIGAETDAIGGAGSSLTFEDLVTALAHCVRSAAATVAARTTRRPHG